MAKPIRWTKRLWKIARGQDAWQGYYNRRKTPLLLAYWLAKEQMDSLSGYHDDPLLRPLHYRLSDYRYRKQMASGEIDEIPF